MAQARFNSPLEARREHGVAGIDRVLGIASQVGQANLMFAPGPSHLAAMAVGGPVIRAMFAEKASTTAFER